MISAELIEQIRDAADIVTLLGEHVDLRRTGSDFRGPCPFHGGTHRNFSVVPKKQLYHCFVCHESGDVFTFWMKRFGLDYPSAVREIAGKVGIAVPDERQAGPDPNEPLYSAIGAAADWFARQLRESDEAAVARAYLATRAIEDAARDEFQLGYAPARGEAVRESLKALGIADEVQQAAGLLVAREDGILVPRFRGRLIFPIADVRGRVVGFGGRILGDGEPKYLNSPETPVFHKGSLLYRLDRARGAIRTASLAVIVEGYVDAIRCHVAGIANVVAPLGTALTPEQAKVLRRYTKQVALVYDADTAGLRATFRSGDELLRQGASVSVVTLPPGEDPDTLVRAQGPDAFRALLEQALDLFDRKIQLMEKKGLFGTLEGRRKALDRLLPTIRAAADPITRELYIARAAERTNVAKEVLEQEAGRLDARDARRIAPAPAAPAGRAEGPVQDIPSERFLVHLMLLDPSWVARVRGAFSARDFRHPYYREIADALFRGDARPASEGAAAVWERLASESLGERDPEPEFAGAVEWMRNRPRGDREEELQRLISVAQGEEKAALMAESESLARAPGRRARSKMFKTRRDVR
ncbi:MAG: DNA primase [Gemmatimonadales bacterium]